MLIGKPSMDLWRMPFMADALIIFSIYVCFALT